jgi:hypothetical protein
MVSLLVQVWASPTQSLLLIYLPPRRPSGVDKRSKPMLAFDNPQSPTRLGNHTRLKHTGILATEECAPTHWVPILWTRLHSRWCTKKPHSSRSASSIVPAKQGFSASASAKKLPQPGKRTRYPARQSMQAPYVHKSTRVPALRSNAGKLSKRLNAGLTMRNGTSSIMST